MEFCLVRENSLRGDLIANEEMEELELSGPSFLAGYQYRSYRVSMVHKFKSNIEVQLGISGDKVEIDPVSQPSSKIWRPQKAVSYEVDSIAACDLIDGKHAGKSVFRLTYVTGNDFKHHDFESDAATASEVATKISHILELRSSHVRQGYLFNRTRRGSRKM
ncbi:target of rapamycin complex 2 subunit MAPKAP1-like [Saccoglossus kowalevskii]